MTDNGRAVRINMKCLYCGSYRIKAIGGENGNPFDRRPEVYTCLDCGKTAWSNINSLKFEISQKQRDEEKRKSDDKSGYVKIKKI